MAGVSSWVFLLLEIVLEASASDSVSGLCRVVSYQPVEHHALLGQSFMNISGISAIRCSARCLSHHGCFSFNYDHINQVCQMNNASAEHVSESFQGMLHFSYYDAEAETCQEQSSFVSIILLKPITLCIRYLSMTDMKTWQQSMKVSHTLIEQKELHNHYKLMFLFLPCSTEYFVVM